MKETKKPKKKRASKYEPKLQVKGSFLDVIKAAVKKSDITQKKKAK